jgi:hypothetical protein
MPIFESKGLLKGKRLRKLRPLAHALWPFIFGLASEVYARLELDYELIAHELGHLNHLFYALNEMDEEAPFGPYANEYLSDARTIEEVFKDFVAANLCFVYEHKGVEWAVFDKQDGAATARTCNPALGEGGNMSVLKGYQSNAAARTRHDLMIS